MLDFFFFKQKTAYEMRISDWSSDVCSTDTPGFWQNLTLLLLALLLSCVAIVFWQRREQRALERRLRYARNDIAQRAASEEALRLTQFSIDQSTVGILWVNWDRSEEHTSELQSLMRISYAVLCMK